MTVSTDDFQRSTGLGANWNVAVGTAGIANNADLAFGVSALCVCEWVGASFGASQFSEATITANGFDANVGKQVFVRRRASDGGRYGLEYNTDTTRWELKLDGIVPGVVFTVDSVTSAPIAGDTIKISVSGSTIRGYKNGTQILTAVDGTLTGADRTGVSMRLAGNTNTKPCYSDWSGGDYSEVTEFGIVA